MAGLALGGVGYPDSFWRSLHHLNRFRGFLALLFLLSPLFLHTSYLDGADPRWLMLTGLCYGLLTWVLGRLLVSRRPAFHRQLFLHVGSDVAFITVLMGLSGGNASGIGLLLIVSMAAAGMHAQPRMVLLLAAMGTLAILAEQTLQTLLWQGGMEGYLRAGLLAVGFFTVSGFSHVLAKGALSSAQLAGEKAAEAQSLARINDWVIQELEDGILVVDARGQILQHNSRAQALLNSRIFPHAGLSHCSPALAQLWQDWRSTGSNPETPFVTGGEGRRLRARFTELEPTRKSGAMILLQDMTELEREAQNMKLAALGRLTANLAHEIRNPLAAIQQAAALLAEEPSTPIMARLTRIIEDNTKRLNGLVEDVLLLNRRDRMQQESIPLAPFLRDFVDQFSQAERVPLGVIGLSAPDQICVRFDRLHLTQILWNLLRNAWRYCTRSPGSIALRAMAVEGTVLIDVFNDGEPVSPEMQQRLFEPFYTTDSRGTGLGLYIARELAVANGGTLRYVDKAGGALFRLSCVPDSGGQDTGYSDLSAPPRGAQNMTDT
jgi:two-component system sensor histidine kinase PilS (NtrC family)